MSIKQRNFFLVLVLAAVSMWVGVWIGEQRLKLSFENWKPGVVLNQDSGRPPEMQDADFTMFWRVWNRVSELYVDKNDLDSKKMIDGAISGMVQAIGDPYTVYLTTEQNKSAKEDLGGAFEGVGIQLGFVDGTLAVVTPVDGSPAFAAGVKSGDLILNIKDEVAKVDRSTDGLSLTEAVKLIRGPKGSTVTLKMYRAGVESTFDVDLKRDTIVVKSVTLEYVPVDSANPKGDKVAWVKLTRFGDRTKEEWLNIVSDVAASGCDLKDSDCKGMVLDMRYNPGGYLEMAVYIAGEFLKPGELVVSQQSGDGTVEELRVDRNGRLLTMPLTVLVNKGSASAAEILAGALVDKGRTMVIGEKSFGKGSVQKPEDFTDGSGIHVTIAKWLRPSGEWIDKVGITPDVIVELDPDKEIIKPEDDVQLMKAIQTL